MPPPTLFLLSLTLPTTTALLLRAYLHNHPLPAYFTRNINQSTILSPTLLTSSSLRLVNPKCHSIISDTRSLVLSSPSIQHLSDEQILARYLKGFFNGWIFAPERRFIAFLALVGRKFLPVGYAGVRNDEKRIEWPSELDSASLPDVGTVMFGGNFLVLDKCFGARGEEGGNIYVDIGFGDEGKGFGGLHRFQVLRGSGRENVQGDKEEAENAVEIRYSCVSCNPSVDRKPFPDWVWGFHRWYALLLFRDGVREVLGL